MIQVLRRPTSFAMLCIFSFLESLNPGAMVGGGGGILESCSFLTLSPFS